MGAHKYGHRGETLPAQFQTDSIRPLTAAEVAAARLYTAANARGPADLAGLLDHLGIGRDIAVAVTA